MAGGTLLALGVGTKPSALFAVAGIFIAVAALSRGSPATRRWLGGAVAAILVGGLAWLVLFWLPDRAAFANVLRIWPPFTWPASPGSLVHRILTYATSNDGALALSLPLAVGGLVGLLVGLARWRVVEQPQQRLIAAAIGWLIGGLGVLAVVSYRPNRYVLPMLPAAAILTAAALALGWPLIRARVPSGARAAGMALLMVPCQRRASPRTPAG